MKVIFFAPHSAIWAEGAFHEGLVAESLMQQGDEVIYVTCGRQFVGACVPMRARLMNFDADEDQRRKVCESCGANGAILRREFGLRGYDLAEKLKDNDHSIISRLLSELRPESAIDFEVDGLPVGRYAMYLFTINRKRGGDVFSDDEWKEYLTEVANALYSYYSCRRILTEEKPDRVVVTNSIYTVNRVCTSLAESMGIPSYYLHGGGNVSCRLQSLIFSRGHTYSYFEDMVESWPRYIDLPCPPSLAHIATNHFLELIKGRMGMVYSAAKGSAGFDVRKRFGIRKDQKIVVAALSSPDERRASEITGVLREVPGALFPTQHDWVSALVAHFSQRDDLFLIVRVHPREFPNRRDPVMSASARRMEAALKDLPSNVAVNWPTDNISIYDLAGDTDVFLTSWSTVGKEMGLLGRPVVLYSRHLPLYATDLNYLGETMEDYFAKIEQALADGWSIERTRKLYRWLALEYGYAQIDVSDSCSFVEYQSSGLMQRAVGKIQRTINPYYKQEIDCSKRAAKLKSGPVFKAILAGPWKNKLDLTKNDPLPKAHSDDDETGTLRIEVRRLLSALYPNQTDSCSLQRNLNAFAYPNGND